jgi:hypothetical protein
MDWNNWILQKNIDTTLEKIGVSREEYISLIKGDLIQLPQPKSSNTTVTSGSDAPVVGKITNYKSPREFSSQEAHGLKSLLNHITSKAKNEVNSAHARSQSQDENTRAQAIEHKNKIMENWSENVRRLGAIPSQFGTVRINPTKEHAEELGGMHGKSSVTWTHDQPDQLFHKMYVAP